MSLVDAFSKIYTDLKDYIDNKLINLSVITMDDVNNAIALDNLSEQKWKPSGISHPTVTKDEEGVNWLYKNTSDNWVYQRIAGSSSTWEKYSKDIDFVDETELESSINSHNTNTNAHSDIQTKINNLDESVVKINDSQTINGNKEFSNEVNVPVPVNNNGATNKLYVDNAISEHEIAIVNLIDIISSEFREDNQLDD